MEVGSVRPRTAYFSAVATTVRARDGCVVETAQLGVLLRSFVGHHGPAAAGQFAQGGDDARVEAQVSALAWLEAETGICEGHLEVLMRDPPRYRTTELWIADRIVTAIERPEAFHDGSLRVHGNTLARLNIARSPARPGSRFSYSARIEFGGQRVGRVVRSTRRSPYRAYVNGLTIEASTIHDLRRELVARVPDAACCGGSTTAALTGVLEPRTS